VAGVAPNQVVLDVGLGFGKTVDHNLQLLAALDGFQNWNRPLLLGASRKSFLGTIAGVTDAAERLAGSLACACWSRMRGAQIIRAHDVKETLQALRVTEAILARKA
jgi:dihydropteroate synthase